MRPRSSRFAGHHQHASVVRRAHFPFAVPADDRPRARRSPLRRCKGAANRKASVAIVTGCVTSTTRCGGGARRDARAPRRRSDRSARGSAAPFPARPRRCGATSAGRIRRAAHSSGSTALRIRRSRACAGRPRALRRRRPAPEIRPRARARVLSRAGPPAAAPPTHATSNGCRAENRPASTRGRSARARASSTLVRLPSSLSAVHSRLKSSSTLRVSDGLLGIEARIGGDVAERERELAAKRASRSRRRSASSTIAPQSSLPCTMAVSMTCGPSRPLSNVVAYSTPVLPRR